MVSLLYAYANYYEKCTSGNEHFNLDLMKNCKMEMNDTWQYISPCITNNNLVYPSNTSNPNDPDTVEKQREYYTGYNDGIVSNLEYDPGHKKLKEVREDRKKIDQPDMIRDNILNTDYVYQSSQLIDEANNYGFTSNSDSQYDFALKKYISVPNAEKEHFDDSLTKVSCTDVDYAFLKKQPNYHPWNLIPAGSCNKTIHKAGKLSKMSDLMGSNSGYDHAEEYNKKNKQETGIYKTHIYDADPKSEYNSGFEYNEFVK
jgi:hypothetical protein